MRGNAPINSSKDWLIWQCKKLTDWTKNASSSEQRKQLHDRGTTEQKLLQYWSQLLMQRVGAHPEQLQHPCSAAQFAISEEWLRECSFYPNYFSQELGQFNQFKIQVNNHLPPKWIHNPSSSLLLLDT